MKVVFMIAVLALSAYAWAQTAAKAPAKTFTQEEYNKKVSEEVNKRLGEVKNKSVTDLTRELMEKEEELRLQGLDLIKREDQLKVNGQELEARIKIFEARQLDVLGCADKNEEDLKNRLSQQVEMVSGMQPAKAAALLSTQEPDISVRILQLLDPKKASKIFNLMDKEVSARLQKQYLNMKR